MICPECNEQTKSCLCCDGCGKQKCSCVEDEKEILEYLESFRNQCDFHKCNLPAKRSVVISDGVDNHPLLGHYCIEHWGFVLDGMLTSMKNSELRQAKIEGRI